MNWEILADLGMRPICDGHRKTAHLYRCRCKVCGTERLMTASELSAARCNNARSCRDCKVRAQLDRVITLDRGLSGRWGTDD
jgi:hypothetical protein